MMTEEQRPRAKDMIIYCIKCYTRITLEPDQKEVYCPGCETGWVIRWLFPDLPFMVRRITNIP